MELKQLERIFKYSKHLIRNITPNIFEKRKFNIFNLYTTTNIKDRGDILLGIYCPAVKTPELIKIYIGNKYISSLNITEPNKIYLPINNLFPIPMIKLVFHEIKINSNNELFYIYMNISSNLRKYLACNLDLYFTQRQELIIYDIGMCYKIKSFIELETFKNRHLTNSPECISNKNFKLKHSFSLNYYANVIKKFLQSLQ